MENSHHGETQVDFHELWLQQVEAHPDFAKHLVDKFCNPKHAPAVLLDDEETRAAKQVAIRAIHTHLIQSPPSPGI